MNLSLPHFRHDTRVVEVMSPDLTVLYAAEDGTLIAITDARSGFRERSCVVPYVFGGHRGDRGGRRLAVGSQGHQGCAGYRVWRP
jgi:hypothetical protein